MICKFCNSIYCSGDLNFCQKCIDKFPPERLKVIYQEKQERAEQWQAVQPNKRKTPKAKKKYPSKEQTSKEKFFERQIKEYLKRQGVSQYQIGQLMNISSGSIYYHIKYGTAEKLAEIKKVLLSDKGAVK